jgi:hypothetical protein
MGARILGMIPENIRRAVRLVWTAILRIRRREDEWRGR